MAAQQGQETAGDHGGHGPARLGPHGDALAPANDPVAAGYAETYGHPGRNLTGFFLDAPGFAGKVRDDDAADRFVDLLIPIIDPAPGDTDRKSVV